MIHTTYVVFWWLKLLVTCWLLGAGLFVSSLVRFSISTALLEGSQKKKSQCEFAKQRAGVEQDFGPLETTY
jgi:hypothetical protein